MKEASSIETKVALMPIGVHSILEGMATGDWTPTEMRVWAAVMQRTKQGASHALFTHKTLAAMIKRSPAWVGQVVKRMVARQMLWQVRDGLRRGEYRLRPLASTMWKERIKVPKKPREKQSKKSEQPASVDVEKAKAKAERAAARRAKAKAKVQEEEENREAAWVLFYFGDSIPTQEEDRVALARAKELGLVLVEGYHGYPRKEARDTARKAFDKVMRRAKAKKKVGGWDLKLGVVLRMLQQKVLDVGLYDREKCFVKHPATFLNQFSPSDAEDAKAVVPEQEDLFDPLVDRGYRVINQGGRVFGYIQRDKLEAGRAPKGENTGYYANVGTGKPLVRLHQDAAIDWTGGGAWPKLK